MDKGDTLLKPGFTLDETLENQEVARKLGAEVAADFGPRDEKPFALAAHGPDGALAGGANGASHWRWLYVRHLWVAPDWRGRGLGRRLMAEIEALARRRDCLGLYVDTFSPEAAAFYASCGFAAFGRIEDFPPGAQRIFLQKRLA